MPLTLEQLIKSTSKYKGPGPGLELSLADIVDTDIPLVCDYLKNNPVVSLNLNSNELTDASAIALAAIPTLTDLQIGHARLTDIGATALAAQTNLTNLFLPHNQVTDVGAIALAAQTNLICLSLPYNKIGDAGAIALAATKNLTMLLEINSNEITDIGIRALAANTYFYWLYAHVGNPITEVGKKYLLEENPLTRANFTPEGQKRTLPSLRQLSLFACEQAAGVRRMPDANEIDKENPLIRGPRPRVFDRKDRPAAEDSDHAAGNPNENPATETAQKQCCIML